MEPSTRPPDFLEYTAPDGELWRIEDGSGVRKTFGLHGAAEDLSALLAQWHAALAPQPTLWPVVCWRYGVRPLFGVDDPRLARAWPLLDLAKELDRPFLELESLEGAAVKCWRMASANLPTPLLSVRAAALPAALETEDPAALLKRYGFAEVNDKAERLYIAERIADMSEVLEEDSQRALCRSMIIQESNLFFVIDPPIRLLRDKIADNGKREVKLDQSKDNKQLMEMIAARGAAGERLEKTMAALGISEKQTSSMKKRALFQDSISGMIEAVKLWKSKEDNTLIDGIFRAVEIEILTRPFDIREAQYRPDLTLIAPPALAGLFNPDYVAPKFSRKVLRRLALGFKFGLQEARGEHGDVIAELDGGGEDAREELLDDAEAAGEAEAGGRPA